VAIEVDGQIVCLVSITDPLRSNAAWLLREIEHLGKDIRLCSGDHQETTVLGGALVGLEPSQCLGRHTPEMKTAYIESLMAEGYIVAMIGDGVNDFGALQAAHVGIAVTDGSAASRFAADAYTTRSGLEAIAELFRESGKVMGVIHRNLVFSLGYNVIGALLAIVGLATPLIAAIAMPISSLVVVLSSITQRTFKVGSTTK